MKKLIISTFCLMLLALGTTQTFAQTQSVPTTTGTQEKVSVKPEDLPEPIKTTLATDAYAGWQVSSAFLITKPDNTQFYEISLKKGEETSKVNLDKDGKKVE